MYIFLSVTCTEPSLGDVLTTFGGVSSYHPPSGLPMRAQDIIMEEESHKRRTYHTALSENTLPALQRSDFR